MARPRGLARRHHRHALSLAAASSSSLPFLIVVRHELSATRDRPCRPFVCDADMALRHLRQLRPPVRRTASISQRLSRSRSRNAALATFFCLLIGYPMALGIARAARRLAQRPAAAGHPAVLDLVPAARLCLDRPAGQQQLVQSRPDLDLATFFPVLGRLDHIPMMNTNFAVILVIVYSYLPFMILPLYATSRSSTARSTRRRWIWARSPGRCSSDITLPLSMPGHRRRRPAGLHPGTRASSSSRAGGRRRQTR